MKAKRFWIIGLLFFLAVFTLSACAPQTETAVAEPIPEQDTHDDTETHKEAPVHEEADSHQDADTHNEADGHEDDHGDDHDNSMPHTHVTPPEEYASLTNPLANDPAAVKAGEQTYNTFCLTCHGAEGKGDGPAAAPLDPKPANLADPDMMSMLSDGYLFWRVSEGGAMEPFNSAMIAWEASLSEDQRWEVISYIRTLSGEGQEMGHTEHTEEEGHSD